MEDNTNLSWEEAVIQRIENSCTTSFGLVDDPDNIISEQALFILIEKGWHVTSVTDPLELRFEYEDQIRRNISISPIHKLFIIRFPFVDVPFDIRKDANFLHLSLKLFFPLLSYTILRNLPILWRPVIFKNQLELLTERHPLDDIETVNFIIQNCLGLDYAPNPTPINLLRLLADMALYKLEIPLPIKSVLLSQLRDSTLLALCEYIDTPGKAVQFLRTVWQRYIHFKINNITVVADKQASEFAEAMIYLDKNKELQTKVTALIAENILQPVVLSENSQIPNWMHLGLHYYYDSTVAFRDALINLSSTMPGEEAGWKEWVEFAFHWAEWMLRYHQSASIPSDVQLSLKEFIDQLDSHYYSWLVQQYPSLIMQPYLPVPTCVHQVLNHIASAHQPSIDHPVALVVIDGMAIQDWLIIQSELIDAELTWKIEIDGIIALVPTLTSVSRQALLSGKLPRYFEKSWLNTNSEETYWRSFWEEKGLNPRTIAYIKGLGGLENTDTFDPRLETLVEEVLKIPQLSVSAFIVNTIDQLIHTSVLGEKEFYNRVRHWVFDRRYIHVLVSRLLEQFDVVIISSDHGHVYGKGIGDLPLSSVAEERALRARVFKSHVFEKLIGITHEIMLWQNTGLPQDATIILPKGRSVFTKQGFSGISHGGASLEETIVPYITITK